MERHHLRIRQCWQPLRTPQFANGEEGQTWGNPISLSHFTGRSLSPNGSGEPCISSSCHSQWPSFLMVRQQRRDMTNGQSTGNGMHQQHPECMGLGNDVQTLVLHRGSIILFISENQPQYCEISRSLEITSIQGVYQGLWASGISSPQQPSTCNKWFIAISCGWVLCHIHAAVCYWLVGKWLVHCLASQLS